MNNIIITYVLDSTAFIRLDFPKILQLENSSFYTTTSVISELKDFHSKSNMDVLFQTGRLRIEDPDITNLKKIKHKIAEFDPFTTLSQTDIDILALAYLKNAQIITNDLNLQNIATNIGIPFFIITGKQIDTLVSWKLKCLSCKTSITEPDSFECPLCGGKLKKFRIPTTSLTKGRGNKNKN